MWNLAEYEGRAFDTLVLAPRLPGAARRERCGAVTIERFPYFFRRWERLADGAILENVRGSRSGMLQVVPFLVGEAVALRRTLRRFDPDVLHVHWIVPQGLVALAVARRRPWLLTTLGGDVYALGGPLWRAAKSAVLRRAAVVTTMNSDMAARLVALGAAADRVAVLPMGADTERVRSAGVGVSRVPHRVLFAGRLVEKKGLAVLLRALRLLPAGLEWSLDVVGDGPLAADLRRQSLGLDRPVRFLGQLGADELSRRMHASEVVVVPSVPAASGDQDGLPVTLLEAMAAGTAVLASRLPGIAEAVQDGHSGMLVQAGDPAALAGALGRLLTDPQLRRRLGAGATRRAEEYSTAAVGERYVQLLAEIAAPGRPSRDGVPGRGRLGRLTYDRPGWPRRR